MADMHWTPEQDTAINTHGGSVIVAAAAGSGKTAVLTERIVRMLVSESDPVEPEELLVVTFTRAAAAEMRRRISKKLSEYMAQNRKRTDLADIKSRLPDSDICTIDSFCIKLVRENYREAGINSDFAMIDQSELKVLESLALDDALKEISENAPDVYLMLASLDASIGDEPLQKKVSELYRQAQARPFPEKWLRDVSAMYFGRTGTAVWQTEIKEYIRRCMEYVKQEILTAAAYLEDDPRLFSVYEENINSDINIINSISEACNGTWDDLYSAFERISFSTLKRPGKYADDPRKKRFQSQRDEIKKFILNKCAPFISASDTEHEEDMQAMTPVISALCELSLEYGRRLRELMDERGRYDFNTILHLALSVLSDPDGRRSDTAKRISGLYREILIDEYQDTNAAQDILFRLISRDETNLFCVGDVKQSIYRFRMAMPEIFLDKLNTFTPFDNKTFPAKIILGKNFRSRYGVLDFANTIFGRIMSEYTGEMDYTADDMLYFGDGYDNDSVPSAEIHLLKNEYEGDDHSAAEAHYVAGIIKRMISDGVPVCDGETQRSCRPGDFCVLYRYDSGNGEIWSNVFKSYGLNCVFERTASLFEAPEIRILLSLLKVINNPSDDISMLATLTSPVYAFTPDELAELRLAAPDKTLYGALTAAAGRGFEKAEKVITGLAALRHLNSINTLDSFMRLLVSETDLITLVSAGENPRAKQSNIIAVTEMAAKFSERSGGLSGFIRFIDGAIRSNAAVPAATDFSSESDAVRMMTIHKSKGLEFPFVFISDTARKFNLSDLSEGMIINPKTGIGIMRTEQEKLKKYPILSYSASSLAQRRALLSEELRILYVGITRARERVFITGSVSDFKNIEYRSAESDNTPQPVRVMHAKNQLELILSGVCGVPLELPAKSDEFDEITLTTSNPSIKFTASTAIVKDNVSENDFILPPRDDELYNEIKHKAEYIYPYVYPEKARPKAKASEFENEKFTDAYFAASKPGFMAPGGISASEAGTANHIFLEKCDLFAPDAAKERDRLLAKGEISERQARALRLNELNGFLNSDTAGRIRRSGRIIREKEFRAQLPLGMFFRDAEDNVKEETILIIGKADLVFIENGKAVIVDYKTDRHKTDDEFREAYSGQLRAYAAAMEQALGIPVSQTMIFALDGAREITIESEDIS